ncbi:hypothetical protein QZH41_011478 [Actinostola sp. cb2023]|nr:hypothetical protein QZH41_011478 [Actinostola sp. cb2023]
MAGVEELIEQCFIRKLVEDEKKTHKEIATVLRQAFPRITGISERSVRRYCAKYNIHRRDSSLSTEVLDSLITSAVAKVGPTYGRKLMTGYIRHSTGLRIGINRVGRALRRVNPQYHHERQTTTLRHFNPIPYYAQYFGHKLHLDQNEKLIRYGVTEVIAVDGYSAFITAKSVMPFKNNLKIYQEVFRCRSNIINRV